MYVGMGLNFHQILYRQIIWVKDHIAFRWVVLCCHQSDYVSDKRDSKKIEYNRLTIYFKLLRSQYIHWE